MYGKVNLHTAAALLKPSGTDVRNVLIILLYGEKVRI